MGETALMLNFHSLVSEIYLFNVCALQFSVFVSRTSYGRSLNSDFEGSLLIVFLKIIMFTQRHMLNCPILEVVVYGSAVLH